MNILYPAGVKREWFDRNPLIRVLSYNNNSLAPHALTERWRYTCPVGRKAYIGIATIELQRVSGAAPSSNVIGQLDISDGVASATVMFCMYTGNVVMAFDKVVAQSFAWLVEGGYMAYSTSDISTGGACQHYGAAHLVEFDA